MPLATLRLIAAILVLIFSFHHSVLRAQQPIPASSSRPPNVVIILCDDLGYGDIAPFGNTLIKTPRLDQMAAEGLRLTAFYAPANVCTPSRAGLLTGRYAVRMGLADRTLGVQDERGLPAEEITLAEALKSEGYATACIGKWHLGDRAPFHPLRHGFDEFFGLPYSNDMNPLELYEGEQSIENPVNQAALTERYTQRALEFITAHRDSPFLIYLAHTMPHVPLFSSDPFAGRSDAGDYGDAVEELDASTGRILDSLREQGLDENTLVIFTSDNGPWYEGSSAGQRGRKGEALEGGFRVPFIARWPGKIPAGSSSSAIISGLDLLPTILDVANIQMPEHVRLDGRSILEILTNPTQTPEWTNTRPIYFFDNDSIASVRRGPWLFVEMMRYRDGNLRFPTMDYYAPGLLFNLDHDPAASFSLTSRHTELADELSNLIHDGKADLGILRSKKTLLDKIMEKVSVKKTVAVAIVMIIGAFFVGLWVGRKSSHAHGNTESQ